MTIKPINPVQSEETTPEHTELHQVPSRRTFGRYFPSRRTFGRQNG